VDCGTILDDRIGAGQSYRWVQIGAQKWMAENLAYRGETGLLGQCLWDCSVYGLLYNWNEAVQGDSSMQALSEVQGLCMPRWHVPSEDEWATLESFAGQYGDPAMMLRSTESYWITDPGSDYFGFSARPGGSFSSSNMVAEGYYGMWWTATSYSTSLTTYEVLSQSIYGGVPGMARNRLPPDARLSVRCVAD
jgi:uncharacterized protein (TIGR02145 family)